MSRAQAIQVARGRADLNTLLRRMALDVEVESLIRRHELSRALATQIAMGQADLDSVLLKRRMSEHLAEHRDRSILEEAAASKATLQLALHGFRLLEAAVVSVDRFEFTVQPRKGEPETIHKLQLKWAAHGDVAKKVRRAHRYDPERKKAPQEPIWKPQDRYNCSNKRLFGYLNAETLISVTTLEGDQFKGKVTWIGRYEFGLMVKGNVEVTLLRHALVEVSE
ncbi:MAG: hypothetical protein H6741_04035 [Alphaproteobacteria bacterium]|nr:hypothetical protein [Alphaproteobacteria bacterium]MCB9791875.1 hypothetical protein [Alphaproteobacteria bacterium]